MYIILTWRSNTGFHWENHVCFEVCGWGTWIWIDWAVTSYTWLCYFWLCEKRNDFVQTQVTADTRESKRGTYDNDIFKITHGTIHRNSTGSTLLHFHCHYRAQLSQFNNLINMLIHEYVGSITFIVCMIK